MYRHTFKLLALLALFAVALRPVTGAAQDKNRQSGNSEPDIFVATFGEPGETPANGDGEKEAEPLPTPSDQLKTLMQQYNDARRTYSNAVRQAKTDEQRQAARSLVRRPDEFAPRFLALAEANADDPAALDALVWIAQNASGGPSAEKAVGILMDRYVTSDRLATVCQRMANSRSPIAEKLLRAVLEKSPHRDVKQKACFSLAQLLKNQLSLQQSLQSASDEMASRLSELYGADEVQRLQKLEPDKLTTEMEALYMRGVEEFGDIDSLLRVVQSGQPGPSTDRAVEILIDEHLESKQLGVALPGLARSNSPAVEELLRATFQRSADTQLKGQACLYLAQLVKRQSQMVDRLKNADEGMLKQYRGYLGAATVDRLGDADVQQLLDEAETMFERVVEEYAELPGSRGKTLGEMAEPELFEIRFLSVGKEAPDIEAEDLDGEVFRLSDYRGKVVMLDFWGHW